MPVSHTSSIDKLLDYILELMEKTNNMLNKCIDTKKDKADKIIKTIKKDVDKIKNEEEEPKKSKQKSVMEENEKIIKEPKPKKHIKDEIDYEIEYDETQDD